MGEYDDFDYLEEELERSPDPYQIRAQEELREFFNKHSDKVFHSRQIEVVYEKYLHWITNRALRKLNEEGLIRSEERKLKFGGSIKLYWHKSYRYYKRSAARLVKLVEEYSNPGFTAALGLNGELLVLEGFARSGFIMRGRNTREFRGRRWDKSEHDLDLIFERDSIVYGIEVKNTLGYMDEDEFDIKIQLCEFLGIRPVFAVRMLPQPWIKDLVKKGGFALIFKYQLYPLTHRGLANRVAKELGLPVGAPSSLEEGTMKRFLDWHVKNV